MNPAIQLFIQNHARTGGDHFPRRHSIPSMLTT